ncbi:MAG: SpaA isopeptide-forming pilin-related protein [Ruminococcus sp.]|jgi:fibro-slime domain-containing protein/pilin isopeptide linkage protein
MKRNRFLAALLVVVMVASMCGSYVSADTPQQKDVSDGLCEHHPEHTAECGYVEATEGSPCTHEHTEECYTTDENGVQVLNCQHVHDETCGYVEATEGSPCTYECEICNGTLEGEGDTAAAEDTPEETETEEKDETAAEPETIQISSWSWVDEDGLLQEIDGVWGLGMPGASEENPLTQDVLLEMLPKEIRAEVPAADETGAETGATEETTLTLAWDLSSIPEEGIWSGDHIFTAALPEGYALAEDADELSVTVQLGGAMTYTTLPSGSSTNAPFQNHLVNGVSPAGTTINLFDYWVTGRTDADNEDPWTTGILHNNHGGERRGNVPDLQNQGINADHAFVFGSSLGGNFGAWNEWTSSSAPRRGIVQNRLSSDGYPVLNLSQEDVNNARYTSNGWYYNTLTGRNPRESLAYLFDPTIEVDGKASYSDVQGLLQVNSEGYYYYDSTQNYAAFYEEDNTFALYDQGGVEKGGAGGQTGQFFPFNAATDVFTSNYRLNGTVSTDEDLNHYFGLTMSTRFIQQNDGYTTSDKTRPVTYEFSGDDDVWVFIDDILVADLGGIHNAGSLEINFVSGEIFINGNRQSQTLGQLLGYGTATLPNNTYHTLDFFYLERGNVDSNMKLVYNLVTIPESSVIKVDQTGDAVAGAEFELYAANDTTHPIATGTTNRNGEFVFVNEEDFPITIADLYEDYKNAEDAQGNNLILKETDVPAGYRSNGDLGLRFYVTHEDEVLLLSNNQWDVGAYAMSKVTTTAPEVIIEAGGGRSLNLRTANDPLMFGVVFQKQEDGNWYPVSGDPLNGWNVAEGSTWNDIRSAVLANPYTFHLASSGAYQIEIENLPGDITKYYHICGSIDEAEYTVAYYYTTASTLAGINGSNTWRIEPEAANPENQFDRVFSVNLYVPNIKNRLFIQKVDETGNPVNGADFALYTESQVDVADDGTVTVKDGQTPYDSRTTMHIEEKLDLNGGGVFPTSTKGILERGVYYLIETSAPQGYILNDTATKIVVDNTGVYADAGTADDGISVLKGVGSIVKSMVQFATDDNVDTTLNHIKAGLTTATYNGQYNEEGSFTWGTVDWSADDVLHLQYANQHNVLDYGLTGADEEGNVDTLTLKTDTGWSKLLIQQCYQHDNTVDVSKKDNLGDTDITKIFSGTTVVRVANQRVGNLLISKTVEGDNPPQGAQFTFEIEVKDSSGTALSGTFDTVTGTDTQGTITLTDGKGTVTLTNGESLTITNLPTGSSYTVTETNIPAGFTPSVTVNGAAGGSENAGSGTIPHNDTANVAFTNTYSNDVTLTGDTALKAQKRVTGMTFDADTEFQFKLTLTDENSQEITNPDVEYAENADTLMINGEGSVDGVKEGSFGNVTFKAAGTYYFTIQEVVPSGNGAIANMTYDNHVAKVTVVIEQEADGTLVLNSVTYDNTASAVEADQGITNKAAFTNQIAADFSFKKINRDGQSLGEAKFAVYQLQCSEKEHESSVHTNDLIEADAEGNLSDSYQYRDCWKLIATADSDNTTGMVSFENLPVDGEYRLVEVKAPDGYVVPEGQWNITYDSAEGRFTIGKDSAVGNPPAYNAAEGTIINYKPSELPFAGNTGIKMFLMIGGILMAAGAAGTFWYLRRKRRLA